MGEEARARRVLTCAWAIERIGVLMVGASRAAATAPPLCVGVAAPSSTEESIVGVLVL